MTERRLSVVRDTYAPAPVSPRPPDPSPAAVLEVVPNRPRRRGVNGWLRRIFIILVALWLADAGVSVLIHYTSFQKRLTARLSAAFGREVEVGRYQFSLWTGPVLEARSVRVAEDSRFGNEYFIRAESLSVRLRWQSLLRGHVVLGTLSLSQPSLNVVRNAAGDWNLAEWLPRPEQRGSNARSNPGALPFQRIRVDGGRVNFKLGDEKLPFAFVGVNGSAEADGSGRWRLDLQAIPWRVSTLTQQAGQIRVAALVGGTSSRLLPASVEANWTNTSISDALRLARGDDYGVRGGLAVAISARTTNGDWAVQTRAEVRQVHRWNLALRADNPDLNFVGLIRINPASSDLELVSGTLEAPHSNAQVSARLAWEESARQGNKRSAAAPYVQFSNATVDLEDLLSWIRAFHAGMSERISLKGFANVAGSLSGWPARIRDLSLSTAGVDLNGVGLGVPVHVGNVELRYDPEHFFLLPMTVWLGPRKTPGAGEFHLDVSFRPGPVLNRPASVHLAGATANVENLVNVASTLGWNLARGWVPGGPARLDLRWQGTRAELNAGQIQPVGVIELGGPASEEAAPGGATLRAPFLNLPIQEIRGRIELKPGSRRVTVTSAQAFGARWTGRFDWREPQRQWQFDVSGDRLSAADLDRWLNPRWRENFIDRVLPFLNSRPMVPATPEILRATGHLNVDDLAVGTLSLRNLRGTLSVGGRHVELSDASARFSGGDLKGELIADLTAVPSYRVAADFSNVNLAALSRSAPGLGGLFAGSASGRVSLLAHGAVRTDLASSLECEGAASVFGAQWSVLNLGSGTREEAESTDPESALSQGTVAFACGDRKVRVRDLSLTVQSRTVEGSGTVDFGRNLDLRLRVLAAGSIGKEEVSTAPEAQGFWYQLSGALAAPRLGRVPASPHRAR